MNIFTTSIVIKYISAKKNSVHIKYNVELNKYKDKYNKEIV